MLLTDLTALGNRLPHDASHTLARVLGLQHVWPMFCDECDAPDPWEVGDKLAAGDYDTPTEEERVNA